MTEDVDSNIPGQHSQTAVEGGNVTSEEERPIAEASSGGLTERARQWFGRLRERLSQGGSRDVLEGIAQPSGILDQNTKEESAKPPDTVEAAAEPISSQETEKAAINEPKKSDEGGRETNSLVTEKEYTVDHYNFKFKHQDFETSTTAIELKTEPGEHFEGCIDRDGQVWWMKDKESFPSHFWVELTGRPNPALFGYYPEGKKLEIRSSDKGAINSIVSFFDRSGLEEYNLNIWSLTSTTVTRLRKNEYYGSRKDWVLGEEKFARDSDIPKAEGYEAVKDEDVEDTMKNLYDDARKRGRYLVIRAVGAPAEPKGLVSASLFSPNHTEVFDARMDYDKGALIYEADENCAPLGFDMDAATWVFPKGEAPPPKENQAVIEIGDRVVYHHKLVKPMTLSELHEKAINPTSEDVNYSEVMIDADNPALRLVAVVNPYDLQGWSKIAYARGVKEFLEVPEFDKEKRVAAKGKKLKNDE